MIQAEVHNPVLIQSCRSSTVNRGSSNNKTIKEKLMQTQWFQSWIFLLHITLLPKFISKWKHENYLFPFPSTYCISHFQTLHTYVWKACCTLQWSSSGMTCLDPACRGWSVWVQSYSFIHHPHPPFYNTSGVSDSLLWHHSLRASSAHCFPRRESTSCLRYS